MALGPNQIGSSVSGQNPPPNLPALANPFILTIGDIGVTPAYLVTPNGTAPLRGSQWYVTEHTYTREIMPTYAIVLAVVFAIFCLLGLLFLLIKEQVTSGYVNVTVVSEGLTHTCQIPVNNLAGVAYIRTCVAQAQYLTANA